MTVTAQVGPYLPYYIQDISLFYGFSTSGPWTEIGNHRFFPPTTYPEPVDYESWNFIIPPSLIGVPAYYEGFADADGHQAQGINIMYWVAP
jgi:hypothetical protein